VHGTEDCWNYYACGFETRQHFSHCEHGECHMARPAHSPKHVVSEAEYVGCLLIVSTELKFDVPPL